VFLYLVVYFICRVEFAHWALKRLLQNSLEDLCSVWETMNNMITLQHTEIKASFETSTHVVEHVFKVTLYKRLLGMISRYALNRIFVEFECVHYPACVIVVKNMLWYFQCVRSYVTSISKRPLPVTATSVVMVYTFSSSCNAVAHTIY